MRRESVIVHARHMIPQSHRTALVVSALMAGALPLVGNALYAGPTGSGRHLTDQLRSPYSATAVLGTLLEVAGTIALLVFVGVIVVRLAVRAPLWAALTGLAGCAGVAVKFASATPLMALKMDPDLVDAGVAKILIDTNDAAFVLSGLLLSLAFLDMGVGLLSGSDVPRWLAWWPVAVGALGVVAGGAGVIAPEQYVPVPFLLLLLWLVVFAVTTLTSRASDSSMAPEPLGATQ
jgi:hypothetical protein